MAKSASKKPLRQQPAFKKLREKLAQKRSRNLRWYHDVGKCVNTLFPVAGGRQYGSGIMTEIDEALGGPRNYGLLSQTRRFYSVYDMTEVKRLSDPTNTWGFSLSWTHFIWLLTIEDKKKRNKFLNDCCKRRMTTDQLRQAIHHDKGKKKSKGGTKFSRPGSLDVGLRQMVEECEFLIRKHRQVWFDPASPMIGENGKHKNPEQLVKLLDEAIRNWETMGDLIQGSLPKLKKMRNSLKKQASPKAKRKVTKKAAKKR